MLQENRALNPVTLIDTKHHKVGALELTLSEAIPFISSPLVRLPLTLPRQLLIPWWWWLGGGWGAGGKSQNTCGFNHALPLISYMVLGNLCNLAEPLFPNL